MTTFSIIIPCFNAAQTLSETLDAIRLQTHSDWEVLCIDDGSCDDTIGLIQRYARLDPRIHLLLNDAKGPSRARNMAAINGATGDVLAFCDADDIWTHGKLTQMAHEFKDPTIDALYGQIAFFEDCPSCATTYSTVPAGPLSIHMLLGENPVCTMSNIAIRTSTFREVGGFDESMTHNEDLDWLIRLVGSGARVQGMDCLHTYYRASPYGLSSNLAAMRQGRAQALQTAARYGHHPSKAEDAIYSRYLARRALRLGHSRFSALWLALQGICISPAGFFNVPKRGVFTLLAACTAPFLPAYLSRKFFA
ncbi:MAG: glycosyltransferase family A protein [Sulfitobacter sp.]